MATRSLNKVFLIGNLTRDPELRYTAKGTPICTFGIATNREWSPSDTDEVREATEFHEIVAWNRLGELCSQLLYKGRKVFIEGRLHTTVWDDAQTGKKVRRTEVVCTEMIALGGPRGSVRERIEEHSEEHPGEQVEENAKEAGKEDVEKTVEEDKKLEAQETENSEEVSKPQPAEEAAE